MSVTVGLKNNFSFSKGYITEVTPLTYPDNACVDIDNTDINNDGSASRRLGVDYETNYTKSANIAQSTVEADGISVGTWENVGGNPNLRFAVVQIGTTLYFHNLSATGALSTNIKGFTINLTSFKQPNSSNAGSDPVQVTSAKGYLFVVSNQIEPFYITYTASTDTIATTSVTISIRDLVGVSDSLATDATPATLSNAHKYNLLNQGWDNTKINAYFTAKSKYPSNAQIWHVAKDSNDAFSPDLLDKTNFGNTPAAKGRFILNAFTRDRSGVSGVASISTDPRTTRPSTVLFYSGRVLYAGQEPGVIYISKVIESTTDFGVCYQTADPTSEQISDLISSDGIHLQIPECGSIYKLIAIRDGVLIFATNGIWQLRGDNGPFTATNQQATKLTDITLVSPQAITTVEGVPTFISESGIYTMEPDKVTSLATPINITITTVQSYFDSVTALARANSVLAYNQYEKQLIWLHNSSTSYGGVTDRFLYNSVLVYNIRLQAFFKYSLTTSSSYPHIIGGAVVPLKAALTTQVDTIVVGGVEVVASSTSVVITSTIRTAASSRFLFLTRAPLVSTNYKYTFSAFLGQTFVDWLSEDSVGINYNSYLETGHVIGQDAMRDKQLPYLWCYFNKTETQYQLSGSDLVFDKPSSCLMRVKWNFSDNTASGKWGTQQQVYRFRQDYLSGGSGTLFTTGLPVVMTKTKVRGSGKSFLVRFDSEAGKDFQLLGWAVFGTLESTV